MKILVTYAVEPEFAPWRKLRSFNEVKAGALTLRRTKIGAAEVDFVVSGMGPERAKRAVEAAFANAEYEICHVCGFAGALLPQYEAGDVVVAESVKDEASGKVLDCAVKPAVAVACRAGAKRVPVLISCERVIATAAEKARLASKAGAVDMESFSIVAAGQKRRIPTIVIRAISDAHDQDMPIDFSTAVDEDGQVSIARVMQTAIGKPGQIGALMRLGRESKAAAENLARFLDEYIERAAPASAMSAGVRQS